MNKKKRIKRKSRLILFFIFIVICSLLYFVLFRTIKSVVRDKVLDEIKGYNITLEKRDTELMKTEFSKLKNELNKQSINYENYAKYISELFIIDLYTINNKKSVGDVGGYEYVLPEYQDNFKQDVKDSLYASIGFIDEDELPEVASVDITNMEESKYVYNDKEYEAYNVDINWKYVTDLDYDDEGIITIIRDNDKLYVAELSTEVE